MFDRARQQAITEENDRAERERQERAYIDYWNSRAVHQIRRPQIMTPPPGHARGRALDSTLTGGWVYDNEPWHWPPKERSIPMGITQEQYNQAQAIRSRVALFVADIINELREDGEISIKENVKIVDAITDGLFDLEFIAIDVVEDQL